MKWHYIDMACVAPLSLSLSWCHKVSYSISLKVKTEQREFIMRLIKPDGERLLYHHTEIFHNLETRILSALSLPLNWIPFISGSFFVCCAHCIECSVKFFSTQPLFPTRSWLIFLRIPQKVLPYLILKRKSFDTIRVGNWGDSRLVYSEFRVHFANFLIFFNFLEIFLNFLVCKIQSKLALERLVFHWEKWTHVWWLKLLYILVTQQSLLKAPKFNNKPVNFITSCVLWEGNKRCQ